MNDILLRKRLARVPAAHRDDAELGRALIAGHGRQARRLVEAAVLTDVPESWWLDTARTQVVVTGFGVFQQLTYNPATDAASEAARVLGVEHEVLPVRYELAEAFAASRLEARRPTLLLHFGVGRGREAICLEHYAHNMVADEDIDGFVPDRWLRAGGRAAYETHLPLHAWREQMEQMTPPAPVKISRDAGAYVCNALYYHSLCAVADVRAQDGAADALFVHIPMLDAAEARRVGAAVGSVIRAWLHEASIV